MNIGRAIVKVRIEKEIGQKELAKMAGISATSLSQIENNRKTPRPKTLTMICEVLEIAEPLLRILSLESGDIPEHKQETFRILGPVLEAIIHQLYI